MNIKLSLFITLTALGNAETRILFLEKRKDATERKVRDQLKNIYGTDSRDEFASIEALLQRYKRPLSQQEEQQFEKITPGLIRMKLLQDMSDCMLQHQPLIPEKQLICHCFEKLTLLVDSGNYSKSQAELEIAQQKLKNIGQYDLKNGFAFAAHILFNNHY